MGNLFALPSPSQSVASSVGDTLGSIFVTPQEAFDAAKSGADKVFTATQSNLEGVGRFAIKTETDSFETIQFMLVAGLIISGGSVLLYGPDIFDSFRGIAERVRKEGVNFSFKV